MKVKLLSRHRKHRHDVDHPDAERSLLALGKLLARQSAAQRDVRHLADVEFSIFSQWGDDGIIQWLIHNLDLTSRTFIEFGVEDYRESNTRFLMMNNNWSGLVLDGSTANVERIQQASYFWKYNLQARAAFINAANINDLIGEWSDQKEIGLLHIDIDGNDYWIWKSITIIQPVIAIIEYNSVFGMERAITIPYDKDFQRTRAHHSNLYAGASLRALLSLAKSKGYEFIGCNQAGNNAYFVRADKVNDVVKPVSLEEGFVESKFRESRSSEGKLTFLSGHERLSAIKGMPIYNTETNQIEPL